MFTTTSTTACGRRVPIIRILGVLFLLLVNTVLFAQQKKINGKVTNAADGKPISGVNVLVKGTSRGTTTADNGSFAITAAPGETLIISAIGFKTSEVRVVNDAELNVKLNATASELDNVIVTALGIKRAEKALGYAASTVSGEQLTDAISGNWTDALSGKVAGLNLVRSNSGPGGSNKIILRGENNLTGDNNALIVIDGVIINDGSGRRTGVGGESAYGTSSDNMPADYGSGLNDINPEDIESITVLKGPNAAALYGQRAANGALIITTKSGSSKKKGLGVTVNSNVNLERVNRWPDLQYEYGQGTGGSEVYEFGSTSATSSAYGPRFEGQMFYQLDPTTQKKATERTPWVPYKDKIRDYFRTGSTVTNSVSIDGGTDKTTARFSVTNVQNNWITPNTGYKRNSVALSVNSKVSDKLQISAKANYNNKWSDNLPGAGYGNQSIMYWFIFWQPNADLDWLRDYWVKGQEGRKIFYPYSTFPENPYAIAYEFLNTMNRRNVTGNVQATYNFTKELSLQVRTSMDMAFEQREQKRPYDAGSKYPKGSYRTQNLFSQEVNSDFLLKYAKKVNSDFDFSVTVGGSQVANRYNRDEVRADSLTYPGLYNMSNAAGPLVTMPYKTRFAINSLYALVTAGYKNFLFVDFTGRQDWNSTLATPLRTENSAFFYPSANLSFILSEVAALPEAVDFAKIRFSAAGVGSGGTTPYQTSFNYTSAGSLYDGGLQNPSTLPNPNLVALRTTSYEAGIAAKFFRNRLGFDLAVYSGNTKNQILDRVVDRSSGYSRYVINAGKVRNSGVELALNGTPVSTKTFKWNSNVVFSANENKILQLADSSLVLQTGPVASGQLVAKVGGSMGDMYGRGYLRAPDGQIVYDATTGYARLADDVVYLGNTIPKWKLGFTNEFVYKRFRLNLLFDAQYGGVAYSLTNYKLSEQGKVKATLPGRYNGIIGNGVVEDGDGKYRPNDVIATDIDNYYRSHFGIDNAEGNTFRTDFLKFREARFDVSLGAKVIQKLKLQRATIGVYGRDLFIWSDWPAFDPEFGTLSGSDIVRGFETAQFPSTRTVGFNLVVGF